MQKASLAATAALLVAMNPAWAQEGPPKAGPEHKRMAYFAGTWEFQGEAKPSALGPAGPMTFKETCELFEGGFAVICRSEGKGPMGPSKAISIMSYDAGRKAYTYTAAESNLPVFTALGQLTGSAWNWKTESKMGDKVMTTRVTVTELSPTTYRFQMEVSDGGPFVPVVDGKATRTSS